MPHPHPIPQAFYARIPEHFPPLLTEAIAQFRQEGLDYLFPQKTTPFFVLAHERSLEYRIKHYGQSPPILEITVLVPTIPKRHEALNLLITELQRQGLSVITDATEGISTGLKRNALIEKAQTPYVTFIDDDDWIPHYYGASLQRAIHQHPNLDAALLHGLYSENHDKVCLIEMGLEHTGWQEVPPIYYRKLMHWALIATDCHRKAPFPDITWGEDRVWLDRILPHLKHTTVLNEVLYCYEYQWADSTTNSNEQIKAFFAAFPEYGPQKKPEA